MITLSTIMLIEKLREVKQKEYNYMVEGNGAQPAEVVDSVVYALTDLLSIRDPAYRELHTRVINFYPDYTG